MPFGVQETGFVRKRLADILADLTAALAAVQDPVSGEMLTPSLADENDPLVQVVNAFGDALALAWEQLELTYAQFDPDKATGAALSGLVQLNALVRRAGTRSTVGLDLTGTPGLVIPAGKRVTTPDDSVVFELPSVTLDGSGEASVTGTAIVDGPLAAGTGTVVKILTPWAGWTGVTNPSPASPGTAEETDAELRIRQRASTAAPARSTIESIYAGLQAVEGVTYCRVYQNVTDSVDSRGISAHSVAPVILGGDDTAIAEVLQARMPAGVPTYGGDLKTLTDSQGFGQTYYWTRPAETPIYVDVNLGIVNPAVWPSDGVDRVKAAIKAFAERGASALGVSTGFDQDGYLPGDTVYASDLYLAILSVPGTKITSVAVGTSPAPAGTQVSIPWDALATWDVANIDVAAT